RLAGARPQPGGPAADGCRLPGRADRSGPPRRRRHLVGDARPDPAVRHGGGAADPAEVPPPDRAGRRARHGPGHGRRAAGPPVGHLHVVSPTKGWSAQVYVASAPGAVLADWGQPVAQQTGINGEVTFDLGGRTGAAVLLWLTDPGAANHAEINEVTVSS